LTREYPEAARGWAILSLFPKGMRRGQGEKGRESPYLPEMERAQGRDWRKARFFSPTFSCKEKVGEKKVR